MSDYIEYFTDNYGKLFEEITKKSGVSRFLKFTADDLCDNLPNKNVFVVCSSYTRRNKSTNNPSTVTELQLGITGKIPKSNSITVGDIKHILKKKKSPQIGDYLHAKPIIFEAKDQLGKEGLIIAYYLSDTVTRLINNYKTNIPCNKVLHEDCTGLTFVNILLLGTEDDLNIISGETESYFASVPLRGLIRYLDYFEDNKPRYYYNKQSEIKVSPFIEVIDHLKEINFHTHLLQ